MPCPRMHADFHVDCGFSCLDSCFVVVAFHIDHTHSIEPDPIVVASSRCSTFLLCTIGYIWASKHSTTLVQHVSDFHLSKPLLEVEKVYKHYHYIPPYELSVPSLSLQQSLSSCDHPKALVHS